MLVGGRPRGPAAAVREGRGAGWGHNNAVPHSTGRVVLRRVRLRRRAVAVAVPSAERGGVRCRGHACLLLLLLLLRRRAVDHRRIAVEEQLLSMAPGRRHAVVVGALVVVVVVVVVVVAPAAVVVHVVDPARGQVRVVANVAASKAGDGVTVTLVPANDHDRMLLLLLHVVLLLAHVRTVVLRGRHGVPGPTDHAAAARHVLVLLLLLLEGGADRTSGARVLRVQRANGPDRGVKEG